MTTFTATYSGHPFTLELTVAVASQNITANTSTVNWSMHTVKTGNFTPYTTDASATWAFNHDGSGHWGPYNFNGAIGQSILMASGSFTVTHASDGTYTLSVSFSANGFATILTASGSGSVALPTIPRATQPTVSPKSGSTDSAFTIGVDAASSAFYHDFYYSLDGGSTYTSLFTNIPATTTSESWTPASSLLPNSSSVTAIIRVDTRSSSGGTIIGTKTVNLPLTVPSSVVPVVSAVSFADAQTSAPDIPTMMGGAGRFVEGWSKLIPTATATGASGSTVVSDQITMNGQIANSGSAFAKAVSLSGAVPYSAVATDSRGRNSATFNGTCTVKAYNFPSLPTPTVQRTSDAAGSIPSGTGTYIALVPSASVSDLTFSSVQYNDLEYQIRTQPDSGGAWTTVVAWTSASGVTWTAKQVLSGYSASSGWNIEVSIRDVFGKNGYNTGNTVNVLTINVPSEAVFMDQDGADGIGMNKYHEFGFLDVGGDIYQNGNPVVDTSFIADTSDFGLVELATSAETVTGTDAVRAVTPAGLQAKVNGSELPTAVDLNTYTTAGTYVQSNNSEAAAGTNYPTPYAGTLVVRVGSNLTFQEYTTYSNASGGGMRRWLRGAQGAVWQAWKLVGMPGDPGLPFATAAGSVLFPAGSTAVAPLYYSGTLTVTFPAGRFSTPPVVEVAARGVGVLYASVVGTPTATGFSCVITRLNADLVANSHYIDWTATQMTPTSGAG